MKALRVRTFRSTNICVQVQGSNQGYQGQEATRNGFSQASIEKDLPFSPQLFSSLQHLGDDRQTVTPAIQGTQTDSENVQLGLRKVFDFGLQSQISYNVNSLNVNGVDPSLVPQNSYITERLTVQLTQSLWQNGFGKMSQATSRAVEAQDLSNAYASSYKTRSSFQMLSPGTGPLLPPENLWQSKRQVRIGR